MSNNLRQIVESTTLEPEVIAETLATIHAQVLCESHTLDAPNFTVIHPDDLEMLFSEYDRAFFSAQIRDALGSTPLSFRLSKRMTSSAGTTTCRTNRTTGERRFEICVSTAILLGCFDGEDHRPIVASGITCRDRLDALQRVLEHEIVHLIEMLLWDKSSCARDRFHSITRRFFSHTDNKHQMITPREKAMVNFGIAPGTKVRFRFEGAEHRGVVNRINKRATVLVEDRRGQRYRNGKHYAKFYVPVQLLEVAE